MAAPTTGSQLWPLLVAPSARRVAHRCGARETDCVPCAPAPRPPLPRSATSYAWRRASSRASIRLSMAPTTPRVAASVIALASWVSAAGILGVLPLPPALPLASTKTTSIALHVKLRYFLFPKPTSRALCARAQTASNCYGFVGACSEHARHMRIMHAMHILLRCARTTLVTCMRNTAMSETCTAVSRLLQEGVVFNVYSGMIIGVNMPFGIKIGLGPCGTRSGLLPRPRLGA